MRPGAIQCNRRSRKNTSIITRIGSRRLTNGKRQIPLRRRAPARHRHASGVCTRRSVIAGIRISSRIRIYSYIRPRPGNTYIAIKSINRIPAGASGNSRGNIHSGGRRRSAGRVGSRSSKGIHGNTRRKCPHPLHNAPGRKIAMHLCCGPDAERITPIRQQRQYE